MRGVILAGGLATRLRPLTLVTNKHLLPIYNKPMIYFPLAQMVNAGIKDVLISSSPQHVGDFEKQLSSGQEFDLNIFYTVQDNPKGGVADGINCAKDFANGDKIMVFCGDNIFNVDLRPAVEKMEHQEKGAMIYGVHMKTESGHYGVIEMDKSGKVLSIEEKPEYPKSDIAQTGIYLYDNRVFDFIDRLRPSGRGELEVTDLNNIYLEEGTLTCGILDWWVDAGSSYDELLRANNLIAEKVKEGEL